MIEQDACRFRRRRRRRNQMIFHPRSSCLSRNVILILSVTQECLTTRGFLKSNEGTNFRKQPAQSLGMSKKSEIFDWGDGEDSSFRLPVFPLRKTVRFPTDRLTLNLYEERYLQMSEFILSQPTKVFGAFYSSESPQFVVSAMDGPIVPLIEPGDIGVVCHVQKSSDDMIPTRSGDTRRRIRLDTLAVARFQVERVVEDGCCMVRNSENKLPFIMVDASWIRDQDNATEYENLKIKMYQQLQQLDNHDNQDNARQTGGRADEADEECLGSHKLYSGLESIPYIQELLKNGSDREHELELLSFALASASQTPSSTIKEQKELLAMVSTKQRAEYLVPAPASSKFFPFLYK